MIWSSCSESLGTALLVLHVSDPVLGRACYIFGCRLAILGLGLRGGSARPLIGDMAQLYMHTNVVACCG